MKAVIIMFLLVVSSCFFSNLHAQVDSLDYVPDDEVIDENHVDDNPKEIKERKKFNPEGMFVGSGMGLFIGRALVIDVSPHVGYRVGKLFMAGIGVPYMYAYELQNRRSHHIYGLRGFMRFRPLGSLDLGFLSSVYLHGEAETLTAASQNLASTTPRYVRSSGPSINVGGGFTSNFGRGWGFTTEILINVLAYHPNPSVAARTLGPPFQYRVGIYYGF